ncbi:MAG: S8/S53 family peptidase [Bacteroidota bacterium]|nr:S8/S53 family peptidase [Bacteroidota bacterium]
MNKISKWLVLCVIAMTVDSTAQLKYWVKFNNKTGTPYTVSNPSAFLSAKSILRRTTYGIPIHTTDLPCNPSYVSQVDAVSNVTVLYVSKWINGVVISVPSASILTTINSFSFVSSSGQVNRYKIDLPIVDKSQQTLSSTEKQNSAPTATYNYGGSYWQSKQLNLDCIHSQGYRGQGMTIAVMDAGFSQVNVNPVFDSLRNRGGILGTRDFVAGGTSVYEDDSHGAMVLSCMAAIKPNVIMGSAPRADYWLLRTEDVATETISEEYNWIRAAEFADSVGVDILTTSLGYTQFDNSAQNHTFADLNGKTAPMTIASNLAARKGMLVLNAAGNGNGSSWFKIGFPADADSICTVGAIDSLSNVSSFSSLGPTADGRIKPDLVARGTNACVSYPGTAGSCGFSNGTSFATPILAGAMACFWQAHPNFNYFKVIDTLRKTATFSLTPNNQRGWGTPNMCAVPIVAGTGIAKNNLANNIIVAPNPFNSVISISLLNAEFGKKNMVEVYNAVGSIINPLVSILTNSALELDFTNLPTGIYFVKVNTSNGMVIKKVVKN